MGLEIVDILSEESFASEFTCAICCSLVSIPDTLITKCSHAFCHLCLTTWLKKAQRCPQCNFDLSTGASSVGVEELRKAQPLAFRVLKRVRVRCPMSQEGCNWQGDYGDLQAHLESDSVAEHKQSNNTDKIASNDSTAKLPERFKQQGDAKFSSANYKDGDALYTKAIDLVVNNEGSESEKNTSLKLISSLYANRAACRLMLKNFVGCVKDCDSCLRKSPQYVKAWQRKCKALIELGQFDSACKTIAEGAKLIEDSSQLAQDSISSYHIRNEYARGSKKLFEKDFGCAKSIFGSLLSSTNAVRVILSAARAELGLGLCDRALRLSLQVNRNDDMNAEAFEVRGRACFLNGDFEQASGLLRESIRLDPDLNSAKQAIKILRTVCHVCDDAKKYVFERKFEEAARLFTAAIGCCNENNALPKTSRLHAKLFSQRAMTLNKAGQHVESLKDSNVAIYGRGDFREAWLEKGKSLFGLQRFEECKEEFEVLMGSWGSADEAIRDYYEKALFECRKKARVDYYGLLELPSVCSEMEIKKAYKKRALELHPDKQGSEEEKTECEEKFKLMGEGLEILCDQFKRDLYDEGYDKASIEERVAAANRAAHHKHHNRGGHY